MGLLNEKPIEIVIVNINFLEKYLFVKDVQSRKPFPRHYFTH